MQGIKVITFDCDGVLFDTETANRAYYNEILAHFGRPPMTSSQFDYAQMHTVDEAMALLFAGTTHHEAAQAFRKQRGYGPYIRLMEMAPDLILLLDQLRPAYKIAIATNRSDTMARVLSEHRIASYFDFVVTALDVANPKPHPDPLIRVLDHFGVGPDAMIYVGDSSLDEQAARAAGVPLVAYNSPSLNADFHITRLMEIASIVAGESAAGCGSAIS